MLRDETIRRVIQFRDDREWRQFHTPKDLAISLSLEAAELLEIFQWSGADLECRDKLGRIREEFPGIPVSLMAQYTPCGDLSPFPELQRAITRREQEKVEDALFALGLEGFTQERTSAQREYTPPFDLTGVAGEGGAL